MFLGVFYFFALLIAFSIIITLPLMYAIRKLEVKNQDDKYTKLIGVLSFSAITPGVLAAYFTYYSDSTIKPFFTKVAHYPITEVSVRWPDDISKVDHYNLQRFLLDYFSRKDIKIFDGGYHSQRGKRVAKIEDGEIPHYWKFENDVLHIYLSKPFSEEEITELKGVFNIWFFSNNNKVLQTKLTVQMNPERDSVLFPLMFEKKDLVKLSIKEQLILRQNEIDLGMRDLIEQRIEGYDSLSYRLHERYEVDEVGNNELTINPSSLSFRVLADDVFGVRYRSGPSESKCYATIDITNGIWDKQLRQAATEITEIQQELTPQSASDFKRNFIRGFDKFYRIRFDAMFLNNKTYPAYIFTYEDRGDDPFGPENHREITEHYKYKQLLILDLHEFDRDAVFVRDMDDKCKEYVIAEKHLYRSYINSMKPENLKARIKSIDFNNRDFSPYTESNVNEL